MSRVHTLPALRRLGHAMNACRGGEAPALWLPRRCGSSGTGAAPPPPPPPAPPPPSPHVPPPAPPVAAADATRHSRDGQRHSFAAAFAHASAGVARGLDGDGEVGSTPASRLSPWTAYLLGLRRLHPSVDAAVSPGSSSPAFPAASTAPPARRAGDFAGAQDAFVHHVVAGAKEAALYSTVRPAQSFLRGERAAPGQSPWRLIALSSALKEMEGVLRDMLRTAQRGGTAVDPLVLWRAMLEQAFLEQYCEVAAPCDPATAESQVEGRLRSLYPYDYAAQPLALRRRLERGVRALLCASSRVLHAQWEQYLSAHPPSDVVAQVLGLEFVLLWWWANPDQLPFELSLSTARLSPPTLRSTRQHGLQAGGSDDAGLRADAGHSNFVSAMPPPVEEHLRGYLGDHFSDGGDELHGGAPRRRALRSGGLLCPAAVFAPAYRSALRDHLARVSLRKTLAVCPLFLRLIEVAAAAATSDVGVAADNAHATTTQHAAPRASTTAARRGREVLRQLCNDWLWPVVCSSDAAALRPSYGVAAERAEDWAVVVAAVVAVSQLRGHLLALRRAGGGAAVVRLEGPVSISSHPARDAAPVRGPALACVRDHLYDPLVCLVLCGHDAVPPFAATPGQDSTRSPAWAALVFARVSACFEEAGVLQRDVARQPATPARLWHLLFNALCDAFPNVFSAGNAVTTHWALLALEGVGAPPSHYYSTHRMLSAGKTQTAMAWLRAVEAARLPAVRAPPKLPEPLSGGDTAMSETALCPRSERRQRASYVLSHALAPHDGSGDDDSGGNGISGSSSSGAAAVSKQHARPAPRQRGTPASLPSFSSAPSPPLPVQLGSPATRERAHANVRSCAEQAEEVIALAVDIFRRYAALPVMVAEDAAAARASRGGAPTLGEDGAALVLSSSGQASVTVLLRLLQIAAVCGEADPDGGTAGTSGLVRDVVRDLLVECHAAAAVHLRKLLVSSAAASGRRGALSLLHDAATLAALEQLPPALGRRRLTTALLWSGLPASALDGDASAEEVYGSGSLAWLVVERNQARFLGVEPGSSTAAAMDVAAGTPSHDALPIDGNTVEDVAAFLDGVLRHLWQLAITIPDPGRVAVLLRPHIPPEDEEAVAPVTVAATQAAGAADLAETSDSVATAPDDSPAWDAGAAQNSDEVVLDYDAAASVYADEAEVAVQGEADTAAGWSTGAGDVDGELGDDNDAAAETAQASGSPLWDPREAVHGPLHGEPPETDTGAGSSAPAATAHLDDRAVALAMSPATPAAQHLFYALLEMLYWAAQPSDASSAGAANPASGPHGLGHAGLVDERGRQWRARLALHYGACVRVWEGHCGLHDGAAHRASAAPGAVLLCRPAMLERVALVLLHTCADVYVVGLVLLCLLRGGGGGTDLDAAALTRRLRRRDGSLLSWAVESSLAQLLLHAGVTCAGVRRWRCDVHGWPADTVERDGGEAGATAAVLRYVAAHRRLLCGVAAGAAAHAAPSDLLLSLGNLLLCSLECRQLAGSRGRPLYRYNAYVNEFVLHAPPPSATAPAPSWTTLRVVLPSVQLTSPAPSTVPPQQLVSFPLAWQRTLSNAERAAVRRRFRGQRENREGRGGGRTGSCRVASPPSPAAPPRPCAPGPSAEKDAYAAAFL